MISIITPCKDIVKEGREKFFRKMMYMLSKQTYQDFEHIVVDSASKDGTKEVLEEYLKKGLITKIVSEKDNNLHEALNKVINLAKGDFIYILNTDDYFSTNTFFEISLKAMEKYGVDYTHGDRIIIDRDNSQQKIKRGDERVAFFRMPFRWQTMLIKREVYEEVGPFDEKYSIASDYKFMMKMILSGKKGHYIPQSLIHSLAGGITKDRNKCINEVTAVLYETYGEKYGLSMEECKMIYLRNISPVLYEKIVSNVGNKTILDSLTYCYNLVQKIEGAAGDNLDFSFPRVPVENFEDGISNIILPKLGNPIRGKIRNNWIINHGEKRMIATTDLQFAYVRPICTIPGKGRISNLISVYWFNRTRDIIPNHFISLLHPNIILAHQAKKVIPVEVVVRRYLAKGSTPTSLYCNYFRKNRRRIYGINFPDNLKSNQELPMGTIVTPTTKALDGHDRELTDDEARKIVDSLFGESTWNKVRDVAIKIFERARKECLEKGLILADTKMEFGIDKDGQLMLIDELLTPDCSRFWDEESYKIHFEKGEEMDLDKDVLVNWLLEKGFKGDGEVPLVGKEIRDVLSKRYVQVYEKITGKKFKIFNIDFSELESILARITF